MRPHTIATAAALLLALATATPGYALSPSTGGTSVSESSPATAVPSPPATAPANEPSSTGGASPEAGAPQLTGELPTTGPTVPGTRARVRNGVAYAPEAAPLQVKEALWAGNQIVGRPYIYGGGHAAFIARGYDCSGTVSFALHGASLLRTPMDSSEFMGFGQSGAGQWITVFTNPGHMYAIIAGLRLDTSAQGDPSNLKGPRWRPALRSHQGFAVRHPIGL